MAVLTVRTSVLISLLLGCSLTVLPLMVSGNLQISFEVIGSYDLYDDAGTLQKAYLAQDNVKIKCDVTNAAEILVQNDNVVVFTKDGTTRLTLDQQVLVDNPNGRFFLQHNILANDRQQFNLFINGVSKDDQGDYQCRLENSDGTVVSAFDSAYWTQAPPGEGWSVDPRIIVLYLPDENRYPECVVDGGGSTDVKLDSTLSLKCTSEFGNPAVMLEWKRNNGVDPDPRNQIDVYSKSSSSSTETVITAKVTITADYDGVVFYCYMAPSVTYFPQGIDDCQIGPINIIDSNAILPTILPLVQVATPGQTVSFQCDTTDTTSPRFQWSWDPPEQSFEKLSVSPDNRTFTIRNVRSYHHLTKIYCKTVSEGVQVSAYGLIRVNYEPDEFEEPPSLPPPQDGGGGGQSVDSTDAPSGHDTVSKTTKTSTAPGGSKIVKTSSFVRWGQILIIAVISLLVAL